MANKTAYKAKFQKGTDNLFFAPYFAMRKDGTGPIGGKNNPSYIEDLLNAKWAKPTSSHGSLMRPIFVDSNGDFQNCAGYGSTQIGTSSTEKDDLDNFKGTSTNGVYLYYWSGTNYTNVLNRPVDNACTLVVVRLGSYVEQFVIPRSGTSRYERHYDNSTWSSWARNYYSPTSTYTADGTRAVNGTAVASAIATKEDKSNKVTTWSSTTTDTHYPSEKLVKSSLDAKQAALPTSGTPSNTYAVNVTGSAGSATDAAFASKIGSSSNPQGIGSTSQPVFVDTDGSVKPCENVGGQSKIRMGALFFGTGKKKIVEDEDIIVNMTASEYAGDSTVCSVEIEIVSKNLLNTASFVKNLHVHTTGTVQRYMSGGFPYDEVLPMTQYLNPIKWATGRLLMQINAERFKAVEFDIVYDTYSQNNISFMLKLDSGWVYSVPF